MIKSKFEVLKQRNLSRYPTFKAKTHVAPPFCIGRLKVVGRLRKATPKLNYKCEWVQHAQLYSPRCYSNSNVEPAIDEDTPRSFQVDCAPAEGAWRWSCTSDTMQGESVFGAARVYSTVL